MNPLGLASIIDTVGQVADDLITTDQERLELDIERRRIDAGLLQKVHETNTAEAQHRTLFVAGWRPAIGWIGAIALSYNFILHPLLAWANAIWSFAPNTPPMIQSEELYAIVTGMLGIAGMRSFEKYQGVAK